MNLNRNKILAASTVLCGETIYTQPLNTEANSILHVNLLQIINHTYVKLID